MNATQNSKFRMFHTVYNHLQDNKTLWGTMSGFTGIVNRFKLLLDTIGGLVGEKARKLAGVTLSKQAQKLALIDMTLVFSGIIAACASESKNHEVAKAMDFTRTELDDLPSEKLAPVCRQVLTMAMEWREKLAGFNIAESSFTTYEAMITGYDSLASAPRKAISIRKSLGETLTELFKDADTLVEKQLDKVMESFRQEQNQFYREYHNTRTIINQGARSTQISGLVIDSVSKAPLKNVLVSVKGTAFLTNTKKDGRFILKVPETGVVSVQVEMAGFKPVVTEAELKLGKTSEVNVVMEKL